MGNYDACDFGDFYPNLNNLTQPQIEHLAQYTAELYCHDDNLGGIQVDLEPYQDSYKESLEAFVTALATNMKDDSGANGCKDAAHPFGRTTSYFTFAHRMRPTFYNESMGPNGIYVFSGYDLKPKNLAFEYNNVSEFAANFEEELTFIPQAIGPNGKFTIALPISAPCHEYEQYIPMHGDGCGPACQIYDANADLGIEMYMYVQAWMDILTDAKWGDLFKIKEGGQFIGLFILGVDIRHDLPTNEVVQQRFPPTNTFRQDPPNSQEGPPKAQRIEILIFINNFHGT